MKSSIFLFLLITTFTYGQIDLKPLKIGEMAPVISGTDQFGKSINSTEILPDQKILLIFYRGNWCPHCQIHLAKLQDNIVEISNKKVKVIVVTPETVEKTKETSNKWEATYSILHDTDNKIMEAYHVAFEVNKMNVPNYFEAVSKKVAENNGMDNMVLPVPATYLIGNDGKIMYVQFDPDYKNRSDFDEIKKYL
ncbi:peroxiredoxin-like family protein [Namhaeicola litoreus]|uniref:thioredoxin-dependent peroxiredoxin n=1 Tax=Namhaeicola litoreus TaxID=1052145 RepID=A0ABW3Y1M8_9FLAO